MHKNFISAKKWDNYIKEKDLPKYNNIKQKKETNYENQYCNLE